MTYLREFSLLSVFKLLLRNKCTYYLCSFVIDQFLLNKFECKESTGFEVKLILCPVCIVKVVCICLIKSNMKFFSL